MARGASRGSNRDSPTNPPPWLNQAPRSMIGYGAASTSPGSPPECSAELPAASGTGAETSSDTDHLDGERLGALGNVRRRERANACTLGMAHAVSVEEGSYHRSLDGEID